MNTVLRKKTNPPRPDGTPSTCGICGSIYHWVKDCPDKCEEQDRDVEEVKFVLFSSSEVNQDDNLVEIILMSQPCEKTLGLLGETIGSMVLDSGTTATVGGLTWYNCFVDTLSEDLR